MRFLAVGIAASTLVACGPIPSLPDPLPSDFAPTSTAPADVEAFNLTAEGVLTAQQIAIHVRNIGCPTPRTQTGFIFDAHTVVMGAEGARDSREFEITAHDGTVTIATAANAAIFGSIAVIGFDEPLTGAGMLADTELTVGDAVTVAGFPGGGRLTTTTGVVTGDTVDERGQIAILTTTSIDTVEPLPGAAVLTSDGEIVGAVYGLDSRGLATIIARDQLERIVTEPRVAIPEVPACS